MCKALHSLCKTHTQSGQSMQWCARCQQARQSIQWCVRCQQAGQSMQWCVRCQQAWVNSSSTGARSHGSHRPIGETSDHHRHYTIIPAGRVTCALCSKHFLVLREQTTECWMWRYDQSIDGNRMTKVVFKSNQNTISIYFLACIWGDIDVLKYLIEN